MELVNMMDLLLRLVKNAPVSTAAAAGTWAGLLTGRLPRPDGTSL